MPRLHDSTSSWLSSLPNSSHNNWRQLLAILLLSCTGCATQLCQLPDDCAHAFYQTQLGWEIQDICKSCSSGSFTCDEGVDNGFEIQECDESVCLDEPELVQVRRPRIAVGPPPEPYKPPMPPKFLPVPSSSVFSGASY